MVDEPLDELRRAWRRLAPPEPPDALADCDARTRAAVEWTRAAWTSLEPPAAVPPLRTQRRLSATTRVRRALPLALAASVLGVLGATLVLRERAPAPAVPAFPLATTECVPADAPLRVAALGDDSIELRSGPVRLILLLDPPPSAGRRTQDPSR